MAKFRPISTSANLTRNEMFLPRSSAETEALRLFMVSLGAYRDGGTPTYPRTRLGAFTSGSKVGRSMQIRGGSV